MRQKRNKNNKGAFGNFCGWGACKAGLSRKGVLRKNLDRKRALR
jgi:hypothetical protein